VTGAFRFGIEEEYFLIDAETKAIAPTVPDALFSAIKASTLGRGKAELLQQQVEVATEPHVEMVRARAELSLALDRQPGPQPGRCQTRRGDSGCASSSPYSSHLKLVDLPGQSGQVAAASRGGCALQPFIPPPP
jgi:hypothetical protein